MTSVLLAGVGSGRDPATWSGIPFHLLAEGIRQGLFEDDLELDPMTRQWALRRSAWNAVSVAIGRGRGGFQYTDQFLERLWRPAMQRIQGRHVLNWGQLYPRSVVADQHVRRSYFLDQTLSQLFDDYGIRTSIRADVAADALHREAAGYRNATAIVVHSDWARRAVVGIEGVDADRVHVVVPGANLPHDAYRAWALGHRRDYSTDGGPLRLVFVGRHPVRKGLDRLLRAFRLVRQGGTQLRLDVIGTRRDEVESDLRSIDGVIWHGLIDKIRDTERFLEVVSRAHVGCLLSRAEAGGIGLREYHALGLAVVGPAVGGSPDHVISGAAILVSPTMSDLEIADLFAALAQDPDRVESMRATSWERREEVSWRTAVTRLREVLD